MKKIALFFLLIFSLVQFTIAQNDDDEVIKLDTSLVLVPLTVTDPSGRMVPGLKKEDFKLFDEGKQQEIAHFDTVDAPFTVVLMLDISDSTKFKLLDIQHAAHAFVDQLRPTDKVAIFTFDSAVSKILNATADRARITNAIGHMQTGGGTSLYSAMAEVYNSYLKTVKGRKALVLFTDGIDTTSPDAVTYINTLKLAKENDAMVFPIQYNTIMGEDKLKNSPGGQVEILTKKGERLTVAYKRGTQYLGTLAHDSGGKFLFAESISGLARSFAEIAQQLKVQYTLGFYPPAEVADGKQHDLKVQYLAEGKAKIKYRRGYVLSK
jgi:VWFA-related protein